MPEAETLNRNKGTTPPVTGGVFVDRDIDTSDYSVLVVEIDMAGSVNTDLTVEINPYSEVAEQVYPLIIPPIQSVGPTFVSTRVYFWGRWDVSAQQRVRLRVKNASASPQTIDWSYRLAE